MTEETLDSQNLVKAPFRSYTLDSEKGVQRDIISISLNPEERAWLEQFKAESRIPHDSKALKFLAELGFNVIHSTLGSKNIKYLASENRTKLIE